MVRAACCWLVTFAVVATTAGVGTHAQQKPGDGAGHEQRIRDKDSVPEAEPKRYSSSDLVQTLYDQVLPVLAARHDEVARLTTEECVGIPQLYLLRIVDIHVVVLHSAHSLLSLHIRRHVLIAHAVVTTAMHHVRLSCTMCGCHAPCAVAMHHVRLPCRQWRARQAAVKPRLDALFGPFPPNDRVKPPATVHRGTVEGHGFTVEKLLVPTRDGCEASIFLVNSDALAIVALSRA